MSAEFNFPDIELTADVLPRIPLLSVIDAQDLAMHELSRMARTRRSRREKEMRAFSILHKARPEVADVRDLCEQANEFGDFPDEPEVDTYVSAISRRPDADTRTFTVQFRQYGMRKEQSLDYDVELFRFAWKWDSTEAVGLHIVKHSTGQSTEGQIRGSEPTVRRANQTATEFVTPEGCIELTQRLVDFGDMYLRPRTIFELTEDVWPARLSA